MRSVAKVHSGELFHHLSKVLRLQVGERLHFSDNTAHVYDGKISEITGTYLRVGIDSVGSITGEADIDVYLIQCLPRGDKIEQIVQKSTELGVHCILPVESDNSQIRLKNKAAEKGKRYAKIAAAAAELCRCVGRRGAAAELAVRLGFHGPRADCRPGDEIGKILRHDRVEKLRRGGKFHADQLEQQFEAGVQAALDQVNAGFDAEKQKLLESMAGMPQEAIDQAVAQLEQTRAETLASTEEAIRGSEQAQQLQTAKDSIAEFDENGRLKDFEC